MITINEFPDLLNKLGFEHSNSKYTKNYGTCEILVDFSEKKIIYPEDNGFIVREHQTCNFSDPENFVVLECVDRLLSKGYKPEHFELEPRWTIGHTPSGGRADIRIFDNSSKTLFFIECKTAGAEFNKAWKLTLLDGAQLFSYAQQDRNVEHLILYTSDLVDEKIIFKMKGKKANYCASGDYNSDNGTLTVFKGSLVSERISASVSFKSIEKVKILRKQYVVNGITIDDIAFHSASTAANFIAGSSRNGLLAWKTEDGKRLKEIIK